MPSTNSITEEYVWRVFNIISLCCILLSLIVTIFVLSLLSKKRAKDKKKERQEVENSFKQLVPSKRYSVNVPILNNQKQYIFQRLTQYAISCLIFSDLLFEIVYLPTAVLRFIYVTYTNMDIPAQIVLYACSELSELFFMASGCWSLFITLCIYLTIKYMHRPDTGTAGPTQRKISTYYEPNNETTVDFPTKSHSLQELQEEYQNAKKKVRIQKRKLKVLLGIVAWGVPAIIALSWLAINIFGIFRDSKTQVIISWVDDGSKTACYFVLESMTFVFRILIYCTIRDIHSKTALAGATKNSQRKKQEERRVLKQMTFFTLPFLVCGIVLVLYRITTDVESIMALYRGEKYHYSILVKVIISIHVVLYPLRGALDGLVYCLVSKWFWDQFVGCKVFLLRNHNGDDEKEKESLM